MVSVSESVSNFIQENLSSGITVQDVISGSAGDYNDVAHVLESRYSGSVSVGEGVSLRIGDSIISSSDGLRNFVNQLDAQGNIIDPAVQDALGQDPSDLDVDDFDDALKVLGPGNVQLVAPGTTVQQSTSTETAPKTVDVSGAESGVATEDEDGPGVSIVRKAGMAVAGGGATIALVLVGAYLLLRGGGS